MPLTWSRTLASERRGSAMPASKVEFLNLGIGLDLLGRAFLKDPAIVHHRHALDHAQRDVHVVLDDDVADMRWQRGEDVDELSPFRRRKPSRRLVEQDEARRARERQCNLELTLLAVGQFRHEPVLDWGQMNRLDEGLGRVDERVITTWPNERVTAARDSAN